MVKKNQGLSHGTTASDDSTNTIGPKSHVSYLKDVFHPKVIRIAHFNIVCKDANYVLT
jgi:hypothetical protein